MKKLLLLTLLGLTFNSFSQNNPPIAVNDTFYVNFNDSISIQTHSYSLIYSNDSDPDGDNLFIDTAFYYNQGFFSFNSLFITSSTAAVRFNYKPALNFFGLDSLKYILRDNGTPIKYDTAWVYFQVKRQEFEFLDLNNIKAEFNLYEIFHNVKNQITGFEVPKRSNSNDPRLASIYAGNLWVSGKNQDSIFANCETFESAYSNNSLTNFISRSGPIMDSIYYQKVYDYNWDRLWKVTAWDIDYHINNWNNSGYQAPEVIENWPAHGDTSKGQAYYLAPFIDNNNDGIYNPYDGDYPKIKGQQTVYRISNDMRWQPTNNKTMKTEIHLMAYAYNCPSDSAINNTVFVDYTIYNRSNLIYDSTYIGMWTDFDIGGSSDDYVGCDVARSTFYGYNGDNDDEGGNGVTGYGNHPPAQGATFLKGAEQDNDGIDNPLTTNVAQAYAQNGIVYPALGNGFGDAITDNEHWGMEHFNYYNIGGGQFLGDGDPANTSDYYNYLRGFWRDSTQIVWGGNGNSGSSGGIDAAKYMFPGTSDPLFYGTYGVPQTPNNWSELNAENPSGDRRGLGSSGPFTFEPDSSVEITLAFVFGRDYQNTGNMAGVVVMQERIDSIRSYYLNDFTNTACGLALNVDKKAENDNLLQVYPNPFNQQITINYELETLQAKLHIYNVFGKLIQQQLITKNQTIIDLSQQANGIYFIRLIDGKTNITKKVMKQ